MPGTLLQDPFKSDLSFFQHEALQVGQQCWTDIAWLSIFHEANIGNIDMEQFSDDNVA